MYTVALLSLGLAAICAHAAPTKRDAGTKNVFAHFMVGFTVNYTTDDWTEDITQAHAVGIDGFALNVGIDSWQPAQVAAAYQAAQNSGTGFQMFLSLDMSSLGCASPSDAAYLRNWVTTYTNHPNQYKYNGRIFVSTFAGENCLFGQGSTAAQAWASQFTSQLTGSNAIHFVPSFFVDPATFNQYSINGMFDFNSGWPISLTTDTANQQLASQGESLSNTSPDDEEKITQILLSNVGSIVTDQQYVNALSSVSSDDGGAATYMGAVSPWFFTHYSGKNWIYYADSHLYNTRWENIIANRDLFDLIEIVTWNDYSESHYIGPIHGAQPGSQDWVDGFDHSAWLTMTSYYISAYKTGSYPTITDDAIFIWARPHPKNAVASSDPVGLPSNYQMTQDLMWAVVFASAPCEVDLWTSDTNTQTFQLPAGVSKINMPLTETGGYMRARLQRNGNVITDFAPSDYFYHPDPSLYNFNAFTASSPGATVPSAPSGPSNPSSPTSHQIHPNGDTSKCLDVAGAVFANGTPVQIANCNGGNAQNWLINQGTTSVQIADTDFCLDAGTTPGNGTQMKIWQCFSGLAAQSWFLTDDNRIALQGQGQCLDDPNGDHDDGTKVQIWTCTDNDVYQIWSLS